jgi:hypothetical protein
MVAIRYYEHSKAGLLQIISKHHSINSPIVPLDAARLKIMTLMVPVHCFYCIPTSQNQKPKDKENPERQKQIMGKPPPDIQVSNPFKRGIGNPVITVVPTWWTGSMTQNNGCICKALGSYPSQKENLKFRYLNGHTTPLV